MDIETLDRLRDRGEITDEQYDRMKQMYLRPGSPGFDPSGSVSEPIDPLDTSTQIDLAAPAGTTIASRPAGSIDPLYSPRQPPPKEEIRGRDMTLGSTDNPIDLDAPENQIKPEPAKSKEVAPAPVAPVAKSKFNAANDPLRGILGAPNEDAVDNMIGAESPDATTKPEEKPQPSAEKDKEDTEALKALNDIATGKTPGGLSTPPSAESGVGGGKLPELDQMQGMQMQGQMGGGQSLVPIPVNPGVAAAVQGSKQAYEGTPQATPQDMDNAKQQMAQAEELLSRGIIDQETYDRFAKTQFDQATQQKTPGIFENQRDVNNQGAQLQQQQAAMNLQAQKQADMKMQEVEKRQQLQQDANQREVGNQYNRLQALRDDIQNSPDIDPDRKVKNMGAGSRVLAGLGLMLAGLGGAKGTQLAMGIINESIDKDIDAQKANFAKKKSSFEAQNSVYGKAMDKMANDNQASLASRIVLLDQAKRQVDMITSQTQSQQAKLNGQQANLKLDEEIQKAKIDYAKAVAPAYTKVNNAKSGTVKPYDYKEDVNKIHDYLKENKFGERRENQAKLASVIGDMKNAGITELNPRESRNVLSRFATSLTDYVAGKGTWNHAAYTPEENKALAGLYDYFNNYSKTNFGVAVNKAEEERRSELFGMLKDPQALADWYKTQQSEINRMWNDGTAGYSPYAVGLVKQHLNSDRAGTIK